MTRPTSSEVSTGLTAEIHIIRMIPHLVTNLTDITSLCIYHQGSSNRTSLGLIQNNLIPTVFLPYDMIFIRHRIPRVKNFRRHTPLFGEMEHLRVAKVGKRFAVSRNLKHGAAWHSRSDVEQRDCLLRRSSLLPHAFSGRQKHHR